MVRPAYHALQLSPLQEVLGLTSCRFGPPLVDLAKRGLTAHLQTVVLDAIVQEQLDAFEASLRERLDHHIKGITIGCIYQAKDLLKFRDEIVVKVDVEHHSDFQDVVQGASA